MNRTLIRGASIVSMDDAVGELPAGDILVEDDRIVGTCTLFNLDARNRRAEIGYALARDSWGQGLMSEALGALIAYAFGPLGLTRLEADVDPRNAPSIRIVEKLGFVREGLLRERWHVGGEAQDSLMLGLLRREWGARAGRSGNA